MTGKRAYKYTVLTVFLAVVFSLGIMEGMDFILRARERQLLAESGSEQEEIPVQVWEGQEGGQGAGGREAHALAMEQIEDAVKRWNGKIAMKVHKPVEGQISMEEAIQVGEGWIKEIGLEEWGLAEERRSVYATLGVSVQEGEGEWEVPLEPYYSFWVLEFSSKSLRALLYVNAVAGRVWNADVYLYEVPMTDDMLSEKLRDFVELSGVQALEGGEVALQNYKEESDREGRFLYGSLKIAKSSMQAGMSWFSHMAMPYTEHGERGLKELSIKFWLECKIGLPMGGN